MVDNDQYLENTNDTGSFESNGMDLASYIILCYSDGQERSTTKEATIQSRLGSHLV